MNALRRLVALRLRYLKYLQTTPGQMVRSLRGGVVRSIWRLLRSDAVRFGFFLGGVAGMYKALTCLARNIFEEDSKLTSFTAGAISGVCIFFLRKTDRPAIAVYIWLRAMALVLRNASREYWWPEWMNRFHHWDVVAMVAATCQVLYSYILEQDSLPNGYIKFLMSAGRKDIRIINTLKAIGRKQPLPVAPLQAYCEHRKIQMPPLRALTPVNQAVLCEVMHPNRSCTTHWAIFCLKHVFEYSIRLYLPVNVVGTALFHRRALLADPLSALVRMLLSTLRSSLFLGTFCGNAWLVQCAMRQVGVYNGGMSWLFGGVAAGLTVLIERKSRRTELAIYVLSPACQAFYNCMRKWGYWPHVHYLDGFMFSAAMGILLFNHEKKYEELKGASPFLSWLTKHLFGL
jgi:hypothetical protein